MRPITQHDVDLAAEAIKLYENELSPAVVITDLAEQLSIDASELASRLQERSVVSRTRKSNSFDDCKGSPKPSASEFAHTVKLVCKTLQTKEYKDVFRFVREDHEGMSLDTVHKALQMLIERGKLVKDKLTGIWIYGPYEALTFSAEDKALLESGGYWNDAWSVK